MQFLVKLVKKLLNFNFFFHFYAQKTFSKNFILNNININYDFLNKSNREENHFWWVNFCFEEKKNFLIFIKN